MTDESQMLDFIIKHIDKLLIEYRITDDNPFMGILIPCSFDQRDLIKIIIAKSLKRSLFLENLPHMIKEQKQIIALSDEISGHEKTLINGNLNTILAKIEVHLGVNST